MPTLPPPAPRRRPAVDAALAAALVALPFVLFRGALGLWWTGDDFFQLRYALGHGPLEYGLDPEVWRLLPNRVLSPLLFASYDLDLALFGPDLSSATAFYAHQLAAVGLAAAALFLVLRLWLPPGWAAAGGLAFLLGAPVASLAAHLMVRHYPESIALALAAAGAWVLAVRSPPDAKAIKSWALSALSALLYLAACAAKEIAVPLPLLLALLPEGDRSRRLRLLIPHAVALALYAGYRAWMLGTPLGGYGFATTPADWPRLAVVLPWKASRELAAGGGWGWAALAAVLTPLLFLAVRNRRAAILLAAGAVLALGPVLPVSVEMAPRYAVAAWLAVAAALPFGLREALSIDRAGLARAARIAAALLVLTALPTLHRAAWAGHLEQAKRVSAEARGFLELGPGDLLRRPLVPPAAMEELRRFAREVLGVRSEADWFFDDLYLCDPETGRPAPPAAHVHQYDPESGRVEEITGRMAALAREHCGSIRREAPLSAGLRPGPGGVLSWELGPYEEGDYAFVLEEGRLRYDMPRSGAFHLGGLRRLALRVRYQSPEGWVTYSDEIELDLTSRDPVRWRR